MTLSRRKQSEQKYYCTKMFAALWPLLMKKLSKLKFCIEGRYFINFIKERLFDPSSWMFPKKGLPTKTWKVFSNFISQRGNGGGHHQQYFFVVLINSVSNWEEGSPDSSNCIMQSVTKSKKKFACCEKKSFCIVITHLMLIIDHLL